MGNKFKDIDSKNWSYLFFDNIIIIKNLDSNKMKIDEKLYQNILIYYIGYVTVESLRCIKIISVNPLYLIIDKINGYI